MSPHPSLRIGSSARPPRSPAFIAPACRGLGGALAIAALSASTALGAPEDEAKAAAYDAKLAAERAEAAASSLEEAATRSEAAAERAEAAAKSAEEASRRAADAAASAREIYETWSERASRASSARAQDAQEGAEPPADATGRALEEAATAATKAADEARRAANEAARAADEVRADRQARSPSRRGAYIGGGVLRAFESFPGRLDGADDSNGFYGLAGYRVHPNVGLEVRGERYIEFEADVSGATGEIDGFGITANVRLYPFTGRFQPYAVVGAGALSLDAESVDTATGDLLTEEETTSLLRVGGGIDLPVTDTLGLNVEGTWNSPGGDSNGIGGFDFGAVTVGLFYRF